MQPNSAFSPPAATLAEIALRTVVLAAENHPAISLPAQPEFPSGSDTPHLMPF
jgi:hypothetical protein